jgi:hypothetical protein
VENDKELEISPEVRQYKSNKWKESRYTIPGVYLGHHNVLTETLFVLNDTQMVSDLGIYGKQEEIFNTHLKLINIIAKRGNAFTIDRDEITSVFPKNSDAFKSANFGIFVLMNTTAIKRKEAFCKSEDGGKHRPVRKSNDD